MKVVVVDSQHIVRYALRTILSEDKDISIAGEGRNVEEGVSLILKEDADIAILDLAIGNEDGLEIIRRVRKYNSHCRFIILTASSDYKDFLKAGEIGAEGYILKDATPQEIIYAMKIINAGSKFYDANLMISAMKMEKKGCVEVAAVKILTEREREVLAELGKGLSNQDIAHKLFITEYTVKKHVSQILYKLELADRIQAALYANSIGLVS